MKTYIAEKPYYVITKDGKYITGKKIVIGRTVVTDGNVEWFDDEASFNLRNDAIKPKRSEKK